MNREQKKHRIEEILLKYFNEEHSERVRIVVQDWLALGKDEKAKDAALWTIFDDMVNEDFDPDRWSYEMLEDLRMRIAAREAELSQMKNTVRRRVPFYRSNPFIRIAAVFAPAMLVVGGALLWMFLSNPEAAPVAMITMAVPDTLGAQNRVSLPDGSSMLVKPGSTVAYAEDFKTAGVRRVELSGEAYFDVTRDTARQFVVETEHIKVRVLGTSFDVQNGPASAQTTVALYRGQVRAEIPDGRAVTLTPGHRLVYENASGKHYTEEIAGNLPDWVAERLNFQHITLGEIFHRLEWYYGVTIDSSGFENSDPYSFRLSGMEDMGTALALVEHISRGFNYSIDGNTVTIH